MAVRAKLLTAAVLAGLSGRAAAQNVYTFTGNPQGNWYTASNWNPGGIPGVNPAGVPVEITTNPVSLGNGTIPVVASLSATAGMTLTNGITVGGDAAITNMNMRGTDLNQGLVCGGTLTLSGSSSVWQGGIIDCHNTVQTGTLTIGGPSGTGPSCTFRGTFHNQGTVAMTNSLYFQNGATVENNSTWYFGGSLSDTTPAGTGGTFRNSAMATLSSGTTVIVTASFENQSHLSISQTALVLEGRSSVVNGAVQLWSNGTLRIWQSDIPGAPTTSLGFTASGQGDIDLRDGNHRIASAMDVSLDRALSPHGFWIDQSDGSVQLDAAITNHGLATFSGGLLTGTASFNNAADGLLKWGTSGSVGAMLSATLNNDGTVDVIGSPRMVNGTVAITPDGVLDVTGGAPSQLGGATGNVVNNRGLVRKGTGNSGNTLFGVPLELHDGHIEVQRSSLVLTAGSTWDGYGIATVGTDPSAKLVLAPGMHAVDAGGAYFFGTGGSVEVQSGATLDVSNGIGEAEVGGTGEFRLFGSLVCGAGSFTNHDNLRLAGGTIEAGDESFSNIGEMLVPAGTSGTVLGAMDNSGHLLVQNSALNLGTTNGPFGVVVNSGTLEMNDNSGINSRTPDSGVYNTGTLVKTGTGQGTLSAGRLDNQGTVHVQSGSLRITSEIEQIDPLFATLIGGTWIAEPGATLLISELIGTLGADAVVEGSTTSMPWLAHVVDNRGMLEIIENSIFLEPMRLKENAFMRIDPPANVTVPGSTQNGDQESILDEIDEVFVPADVPEPRLITPVLNNYARLVPGGHDQSGPFNLTGNLVCFPTSRLLMEIGGPRPLDDYDRFVVTGSASVAGTLDLSLINNFVPQLGNEFLIFTASGGVSGTFSSIVQPPDMPAGLSFEPVYASDRISVRIVNACYANCDGSTAAPVLNVNDFICFQSRFAAGSSYANCDGSTTTPVLNVNDFICFQSRFAAGCR